MKLKNDSFVIYDELCTLNEYIKTERNNRYQAGATKTSQTLICWKYARDSNLKLNGLFDLEINWFVKDYRTDSDNIFFAVKFILDGIVKAGVLPGDSRRYVRNIYHNIFNQKPSKIEVIFKKVIDLKVKK
jgi:hypothetical protein